MNLFTFELRKMILNKKFLIIFILVISSIVLMFFRNESLQKEINAEKSAFIQKQFAESYRNSEEHVHNLKLRPEDESEKDLQKITSSLIEVLYELREVIREDDWQHELQLTNEQIDLTLEYIAKGGESFYYPPALEKEKAMNDRLLQEGITPEHEQYSISTANFTKIIIDIFIFLTAIVLLFVIVGETITTEFEHHSVNLLFTQPLNRTRLFGSKFIHAVISFLIITCTVLLTTIGISRIFGEKGTFTYPVIIETINGFEFITTSKYIMQSLLCLFIFMMMLVVVYYLISLIVRRVLPSLFIFLVVLGGGYVLTTFVDNRILDWLNPFKYLLINHAITVQVTSKWYTGIPIALLVTVILYFIALQILNKAKIES